MSRTAFFALMILLCCGSPSVLAMEPMDIDSIQQVIQKLEKALPLIKEDSIKGESLIARLADLYSEQGRKKYLSEIEQNCKNCLGSRDDRNKAIFYYTKIYKNSKNQKYKNIALFQMGHLHRITGKDREAEKLFLQAIDKKSKNDKEVQAEARAALVEIYYARGHFSKALQYANEALSIANLKRPGLTMYRKAWCLLNTGQNEKAKATLIKILRTPELLSFETSEGVQLDKSFQQDVARDLALFLAKNGVKQQEVELLIDLSPSDKVYDNLFHLGQELSRLGSYKGALLVWEILLNSQQVTQDQQLEIKILTAELYLMAGQPTKAISSMELASDHWLQKKCNDEVQCESLRIRFKNMIINWHKLLNKKVNKNLLLAYRAYSRVFVQDYDMHLRGAQLAKSLGHFIPAREMFRLASESAQDKDSKGRAFEAALIGEIEAAEALKDPKFKQESYEHYLRVNSQGQKALEVHYQIAHLNHQGKKYLEAAKGFDYVATHPSAQQKELKSKAADLAIDALVMAQQHQLIEQKAVDYAQTFKSKRVEFFSHARTASLYLVKIAIESPSSQKEDYKKAMMRLKKLPREGISAKEKIVVAKGKIKIAQELQNIEDQLAGAKELYSLPKLSEIDNEMALGQIVWAYELKSDFKQAYKYSKKMKLKHLSKAERALWLAVLADLAGQPSRQHYLEFIKFTPSRKQANNVRAKLISESRRPWSELKNEITSLVRTPEVLATLALDLHMRQNSYQQLKELLKYKSVRSTPAGLHIMRQVFIKDSLKTIKKIQKQKLLSQSSYLLKSSLKKRVENLAELDRLANQAISSQDWYLQLLTLESVQRESERLIKDLSAVPLPRGLSQKQQEQYTQQMAKQIEPFKRKRDLVESKTDVFWSNHHIFSSLKEEYESVSYAFRNMINRELELLKNYTSEKNKKILSEIISLSTQRPNYQKVKEVWRKVKKDPFDTQILEELKDLEQKRDSFTVVAYLDIRKAKLLQGGQR